MKTIIITGILTISSLFSTETKKIETQDNIIVYEQESESSHGVKTIIIYTKAPTPWVKVFNN